MKQGNFAAIADAVRDNREASTVAAHAGQHKNAAALLAIAADLHAVAKRAEAIPGTYRVWCHLYDALANAEDLAAQWNERKHP